METNSNKATTMIDKRGKHEKHSLEKTDHCHVCNVEVPRVFMQVHLNSQKHIACFNITREAMKRATEGLTLGGNDSNNTEEVHGSEYFCEPCVVVVEKADEIAHKNSPAHKKSLYNDDLLEKLSKIYIDRSVLDTINLNILNNLSLIEQGVELKCEEYNTEIHWENQENVGVLKQDEKCEILFEETKSAKEIISLTQWQDEEIGSEASNYTQGVNVKNFEESSNIKLNVPKQHEKCKIIVEQTGSDKEITLTQWQEEEISSDESNNAQDFNVENYTEISKIELIARKQDKKQEIIVEHTGPTKEITPLTPRQDEDIGSDVTNKDHQDDNKGNLEESTKMQSLPSCKTTYNQVMCEICNVQFQIGKSELHKQSKQHILKLKQKYGIVNTKIHYQMKQTENPRVVSCRVCNIELSVGKLCIKEHLHSTEHITAYEIMLVDNTMEIVNGNNGNKKKESKKILCRVCDSYLSDKYAFYHIETSKHQCMLKSHNVKANNEDDFDYLAEVLVQDDMRNKALKYYEVGNDVEPENSKQNELEMVENLRGDEDIVIETSKLKTANVADLGNFIFRKGNVWSHCVICNILPPTQYVTNHLESIFHRSQCITLLQTNMLIHDEDGCYCKICRVFFPESGVMQHISESSHYEFFLENMNSSEVKKKSLNTPESKHYRCKACNIYMSKNPNDIKIHEQDKSHAINVVKILKIEPNHLHVDFKRTTDNDVYCRVCKKKMNHLMIKKHLTDHIHQGNRFQMLYTNQISNSSHSLLKTCKVCVVGFDELELYDHIESDSHKKEIQKLVEAENELKRQYMKEAKNMLICKICEDGEKLYNKPMVIYGHIDSYPHKKKHKLLLSNNRIKMLEDNTLHCELCNVDIDDLQDLVHMNSDSHRQMCASEKEAAERKREEDPESQPLSK